MKPNNIDLERVRLEHDIIKINSQIADALEMTEQAKALSECSESKLLQAHLKLEELYINLGKPKSEE